MKPTLPSSRLKIKPGPMFFDEFKMKLNVPNINVRNFSLFILSLSFCFAIGCGPKEDAPAIVSSPTENNVAEPVENKPDTTPEVTPEVTSSNSAPETKPAETESNNSQEPVEPTPTITPSVSPSATENVVNHQDPTSYPITELAAKSEGQLAMLSWNVESGGALGEVVAKELTEMNTGDRYDVVTLTEVLPADLGGYRNALGAHYKFAYSKSGRDDRLQILYNENKFEKIRHFELKDINIKNRYRAPLVVHLKERSTESEFLVMVNHLARGKEEIRQEQATMLVEWARKETLPIVGLGDYNFDYVFATDKGNPAFTNFMRDNIYRWVKPTDLIDTNWYDDPREPDGKDDYPGSMLDFAFVSGPAKDWKSTCTVIVRENDFPDGEERSDHRPFEVIIDR